MDSICDRNNFVQHTLYEVIRLSERRIVTTSFGTYSSAILNLISKKDHSTKVIWCDTRYNTNKTYEHAQNLIHCLKLNVKIYRPLQDKETIESMFGLPSIDDPKYNKFKEVIKLEPFRRAIKEHQPEVWFTNIRFRNNFVQHTLYEVIRNRQTLNSRYNIYGITDDIFF